MPLCPPRSLPPLAWRALLWGLAAAVAAGPALAEAPRPRPRPAAPLLAVAPGSAAGAYLAARQALDTGDFLAAGPLVDRALAVDPKNPALLDGAVTARLALGDLQGAAAAAEALVAQGARNQVLTLARVARAVQAQDFAAVNALLDSGQSMGQAADGLIRAWADLGQGSMTDALAAFDRLSAKGGLQGLALYHKALALALSGDLEGALAILDQGDIGPLRGTRRAFAAKVQVLALLDRRPEALAALDASFPAGQDPAMDDLRRRIAAGAPLAFDIVTRPADGVAEVLFNLAAALVGQADTPYVLVFARTAAALRPDHVETTMLAAQLAGQLGQNALAAQTFALIAPENPAFSDAEIGRAEAALRAGQGQAALGILAGLAESHPKDVPILQAYADTLRRQGQFATAVQVYDRAIAALGQPGPRDWGLYYARAICLSELKLWPQAEAGFRQALALNPDQPQVLNYLGYSYVDRGENLDEALAMIQRAVLAAPDQGYIVDSLAWALYRLGRFEEAVLPMERAALLEPIDPIVTDHLGDVYWMVGRKMEARFQWRRALSFAPSPPDEARIRRKLELGLDQVLADEAAGAPEAPADPEAPAAPDAAAPENGG